MKKIDGLTIGEAEFDLENGNKGKLAVFHHNSGSSRVFEIVVNDYVGKEKYIELRDINMDDHYNRVILSNINDIKQEKYDGEKHKLNINSKKKPFKIEKLVINETEYNLENGEKGKIAVLMYNGDGDPRAVLESAIDNYVGGENYYGLMDAELNCPWMRVVLSRVNNIKHVQYDPDKHKLNTNPQVMIENYQSQINKLYKEIATLQEKIDKLKR